MSLVVPTGWTRSEVESVLKDATDEWERAPDYYKGDDRPIFFLKRVLADPFTGCPGTVDVEVWFKTKAQMDAVYQHSIGLWQPDTDPGGAKGELWLNIETTWTKPHETPVEGEISLLGLLVHEMGHSLGIWHSGDSEWSFDGQIPTMIAGMNHITSKAAETLSQDDLGSAQWVDFKDLAIGRYFSDDPSFEGPFPGNWGRYSPSDLAVSNVSLSGDHSLLIESDGAGVFITSVFDPWAGNTTTEQEMPGMDPPGGEHRLRAFTQFHETATGDGIKVGYEYAFLPYDPTGEKEAPLGHSWNFSGYFDVVCEGEVAGWETCKKAKVFDLDANPTTEGTVAFRVRFLATDADVHIDRSGARRVDP